MGTGFQERLLFSLFFFFFVYFHHEPREKKAQRYICAGKHIIYAYTEYV